jgi:hypothetical protein
MSEGFLSRWSRLKRSPALEPQAQDTQVLLNPSAANAPAMPDAQTLPEVPGSFAAPGSHGETPAGMAANPSLQPWAGVNPAYRPAPVNPGPGARIQGAQVQVGQEPTHSAQDPAVLPSIESLNMDSDFKPFMQANVSSESRNAALKKLFADPSFNVMDGLDTYIDDYSKPDPIPAAMLKELMKAEAFCLFDAPEEDAGPAEAVEADSVAAQNPVEAIGDPTPINPSAGLGDPSLYSARAVQAEPDPNSGPRIAQPPVESVEDLQSKVRRGSQA